MIKKIILPCIAAVLFFSACKKDSESLGTTPVSEYTPLVVGKYITYQMDSFKYKPFTLQGITVTYQVKYIVDGQITDNLGRPAYRIVRQIRMNPTDEWVNDNSFMATPGEESYELVDNNLRFLKLHGPVKDGFTWKGNSYINTTSQYTEFDYLRDWDYVFDSVGAPLTLGSITLDNTIKVAQRDEEIGTSPDVDPSTLFFEKNFGVEYYAKGIGLVYRKFLHTRYQNPGNNPYYESDSKGITLTMIDHN